MATFILKLILMSIMNRLELVMFQIQYYNNSSISTMQPTVRFNDISILRVSAMLMVVFYNCLCPYPIWDGTDFYINDESVLLKSKDECHNITSDIIESTFGVYKSIQPKNKHCGITPIVLALSLYGKVTDSEKRRKIDFKEKMECVRMADIKDWKETTLLDNWQVRRMLDLKSKKQKRLKFLTA